MLEATTLSKRYGALSAVAALELRVHAGEVLCLLGPNGAGKTTTINMFLGFVTPSEGTARVCGLDVASHDVETKKHLGYIPENVSLYPYFTGLENLGFFLSLSSSREPSRPALLAWLEEAGLPAAAADRRVSTYSKGMRQKVGIALALARRSRALLLDEPTSGLDPGAAAEFSRLIGRIRDRGAAVLMVTHDLFRAREIATRIGIMRRGRLADLLDPRTMPAEEVERRYLAAVDPRAGATEESWQ